MVQVVIVAAAGVLLGMAIASFKSSRQSALLRTELASIRASLEQAEEAQANASMERDRSNQEADTLRAEAAEVHQLRGEIVRLKQQLTESQAMQQHREQNTVKGPIATLADGVQQIKQPDKASLPHTVITLENAPPNIRTAILTHAGEQPVSGLISVSEKDGSYGFKGQLADGRWIRMRLSEDSSVLEKATQVAPDTLPTHIQGVVPQYFGESAISDASEIHDAGRIVYEVGTKRPEGGMQMRIRDDGTVLSYSAKFRPPDQVGIPAKTK